MISACPAPRQVGAGDGRAYAYAYSLDDTADPCYRGGIMDFIPTFCATLPDLCVAYAGGKRSGWTFTVGDVCVSPRVEKGGLPISHSNPIGHHRPSSE